MFAVGDRVAFRCGLDLAGLEDRIVRPDLTSVQFAREWHKISRKLRWPLLAAAPALGLWVVIVGPRLALGRRLGIDDLPTPGQEEISDAVPGFDEAVLGARDRALCQELERLAAGADPAIVGVCWGASHMRAVVALLFNRLSYRIVEASWMTVF